MGKNILCIGDPHADPDHDNSRFDLLGKFILDRQPDIVVCLGDMANCDSLSSYEKGKKSFEGRRFLADVGATIDAQERIWGPTKLFNQRRKRNKDKQYKPRTIMLGGNHDCGRINRIVETSPELEGLVSLEAFKYKNYWDEFVPYKDSINVCGIMFSHHFVSGVLGRPISGQHLGYHLLAKNLQSSIAGHAHVLSCEPATRADGKRMWGLSVGCYVDYVPSYAQDSAHIWWSGLVMLHGVEDGDFDIETISMKKLREIYG